MEPFYHLLSPQILNKDDKSYRSVEELETVLSKDNCNNIAITGTYGSGKSSILKTLESLESQSGVKYFNVSLSTLDECITDVEYSIVQQLIYKADEDKLHQSRFCKIKHLDNKTWTKYSAMAVILIIAFIIAFEPKWLQAAGIYELYHSILGANVGYWANIVFDFISVCYMLFCAYFIIKNLVRIFHNSKFNKFDTKYGSVELSNSASAFNKHLDEIVYFFRANDYNVIVFEDLDRFKDSRGLFLKLREINLLINDSEYFKKCNKSIRFIYAIKDEIFTGEERTKYFDYIVSTIPVVNTINSGDYLINKYGETFTNITSKQWVELGEYIEGMRELNNILNEFIQYKSQIGDGLEDHKLFAITVYKNKTPKDYAKLHYKSGILYKSIDAKELFIEAASKESKQELSELKTKYLEERGKIFGIRKLYVDYLINEHGLKGFLIGGKKFDPEYVIDNDELFNRFTSDSIEQYYIYNQDTEGVEYQVYTYKFNDIESEVNTDMGYSESIQEYENNIMDLSSRMDIIKRDIRAIERSSLSTVIMRIKKGEDALKIICDKYCEEFDLGRDATNKIDYKLCEMVLFLLRHNYIDEYYSSYISQFHPGSLMESDNDFLKTVKLGISKGYDYRLNNADALLEKMQLEYFDKAEVLNNDLLDGLIKNGCENNVDLDRLIESIKNHHYIDFIIGYEQAGTLQKEFFTFLLSKWADFLKITYCQLPRKSDRI